MRYLEVKIYTAPEGIDPLTLILTEMGIAGFAVEDIRDIQELMSRKNPYDWDYIDESLITAENIRNNVTLYLDDTDEGRNTLNQIREEIANADIGEYELVIKTIDDSEWKDKWKEYFKPTRITERIVIKPTWEEYAPESGDLVIEMDPGMAFGTGAHPTTTLCIRLLEKYIEPGSDTVLDVGCGSGILSVASALLGAESVVAVDIDPVAVEVTKENAERNGVADKIAAMEGDLTKGLSVKADIVAANLMADLVIMLSKDIVAHLSGKGIYISSGILADRKNEVTAAIEACGFRILEVLEEEEWCAVAAQRRPQ